jgi:hypothetical protein
LTGPLFWLHGDESRERLESYVAKVAEGGNGCFTVESRPHSDWLGPNWWRDVAICLEAAKKHNLKMWIFDEKWWPSQGIGGKVPARHAAKRLVAQKTDVQGPRAFEADGCAGERYVAAIAGRVTPDGKLDGSSLVDLAPSIQTGKLRWQIPDGKWAIVKFTHEQAPPLGQNSELSIDGASRDCVDYFLKTVYQPHYDHFAADFGKTIPGFFYDEPETRGDWGTELNCVLAERNIDWKKAYTAYKVGLSGEEQIAAVYEYLDAFAEAWGRTLYGGMTQWCHKHGVQSIGHFMEHGGLYHHRDFCAGDMMRLQGYSDMGAIDVVFTQFVMGKRDPTFDNPVWQTPKLGSSISHVYGKTDDVTMVEIFGARGQDLTYSEMKWWTDHVQVSGVNFLIPHSFNPRSPYDADCPPYFYNGGFEPRWPLYRVFADYTSRLTSMLTGGRHVCPVALLSMGQSAQVGRFVPPEGLSGSLQDAMIDCDWLPYDVFVRDCSIKDRELQLHGERYKVLVVPPVETIPVAILAKAKAFHDAGGIVIGYGFLPSKSATLGKSANDVAALCKAIWGDASVKPSDSACLCSPNGGQSFFLPEKPTRQQLQAVFATAGVVPDLKVLAGETNGWLHLLHRVKDGRDVFLVCNQNHQGPATEFQFRATAAGVPECWDAVRNEITAIPFERHGAKAVDFSLTLEPLESVLLVFQPERIARPMRIEPNRKPSMPAVPLVRLANPPQKPLAPDAKGRPLTLSPVKTADPFQAKFVVPADVDLAKNRVLIEMDDLPDQSASVAVNGVYAGGVIGKPSRLDISHAIRPGENAILIEPLSPKTARIVFYPAAE